MRLTKHFALSEFDCKDGNGVPPEFVPNVRLLAMQLEELRGVINRKAKGQEETPIVVLSGYRTPRYNKQVGGKEHSQHLQGKAADITVKGWKPETLAHLIEALIQDGQMMQGGIGIYNGFVHYDIRGTVARWRG